MVHIKGKSMNRVFITLLLVCSFTYTLSGNQNSAFVNFISNVEDTTIFLDGKNIGKTPIKQYEVIPNKKIQLKAIVDKNYYNKDIKTTITINNQTIPTFSLKFQKATTKVFFVGDDAELYINDKFIKKLNDTNRVVTLEANKDVKIRLQNGEADVVLHEDLKANRLNTIKYNLKLIPKDVRIYTSTINDLMWEDTKDATNTNINWEKAQRYCQNLEIAQYDDFRLPTIDELSELYDYKDKIYNGFGGKFYWSGTTYSDEHNVWNYSVVKNFEDGTNQKSIKEFEQGRVRCVREIKKMKEKNE